MLTIKIKPKILAMVLVGLKNIATMQITRVTYPSTKINKLATIKRTKLLKNSLNKLCPLKITISFKSHLILTETRKIH